MTKKRKEEDWKSIIGKKLETMQCFDEDELFKLVCDIKATVIHKTKMCSFRLPIKLIKQLDVFKGVNHASILSKDGFIRVAIAEKLERMKKKKYGEIEVGNEKLQAIY